MHLRHIFLYGGPRGTDLKYDVLVDPTLLPEGFLFELQKEKRFDEGCISTLEKARYLEQPSEETSLWDLNNGVAKTYFYQISAPIPNFCYYIRSDREFAIAYDAQGNELENLPILAHEKCIRSPPRFELLKDPSTKGKAQPRSIKIAFDFKMGRCVYYLDFYGKTIDHGRYNGPANINSMRGTSGIVDFDWMVKNRINVTVEKDSCCIC